MEKENLKNQALLEEFEQSHECLRHIENQRWKIFTIFGTFCSIWVGGIYYLFLSPHNLLVSSREIRILFVVLCVFLQLVVTSILLILLKLRYEICLRIRDLYIKRRSFDFTLHDSVFADTDAPELFKADSVDWMALGVFCTILIISVIPSLIIFWGITSSLTLFFVWFSPFILIGFSIGFLGRGMVDPRARKKVNEFFKQHQENIPLIIPWLILPLPFLVLALYILCERNFALFASVLPFLLVSISLGIFVYRWAIYVDKLREIDEKIETMVILADAKLMEKIGVAEDEIRNGKTRPFAELLKEADL